MINSYKKEEKIMTEKRKIGIGCDHGGLNLKNKMIEALKIKCESFKIVGSY